MIAFALTSCQKNDISDSIGDSDGALTFGVSQGSNSSTRAAELMNSNLNTSGVNFPIYAYHGAKTATKILYFSDTLTYKGTTPKWETAIRRFLPQEGVLQIYAYYPTTGVTYNESAVLSASGAPTLTYSIQSDGKKTDLVAANIENHAGTKVVISFKHILSQINFGVKDYTDAKIEIANIAINEVNNAGVFHYDTWKWDTLTGSVTYTYPYGSTNTFTTPGTATDDNNQYIFGDGGNWGPGKATTTYYVGADNNSVASEDGKAAPVMTNPKNSLMLMPQPLTTGMTAAYVTFEYKIQDMGNAYIAGSKDAYAQGKFDLNIASAPNWLPNNRYVYMIDFKRFLDGQLLTFEVDVESNPWVNYNAPSPDNGLVLLEALGQPIFDTNIKPLANGENYSILSGHLFTSFTWDWSSYEMTNKFTPGQSFTFTLGPEVILNGNTITIIPPADFKVTTTVDPTTVYTFTRL